MDSQSLRLFLSLADNLHFGKTSREQHVSPSALSRSIKQLEDELGAPLFVRDSRSVQLTREGRQFREYASEVMSGWHAIRQRLMQDQLDLHGELSLYCSVTASYSFLYDILSSFRQDYPRIEMKLHTGDPAKAVERVQQGLEDLAIGARPDNLPAGVDFQSITRSELRFIGPQSPQLLTEEQLRQPTAQSWKDVPMILSEEGLARTRTDRWLKNHGIKPRIYAQVSGNEAIVSMVSLGFGIGVVPQIVLDNSPLTARIRIYDIQPPLAAYDIGLFALEKRLKDPLIAAFWNRRQ
ncbi:HTH-type transcriptional activator IlvY [Pseudomonas sp. JS3066]|uniref:HTH-type transcriptional activator IlvY n=1 Tax=unclassified Pseudomonas TaxID=196821 RepID=UPI000EAA8396|nr:MULTISPECIES: HTH-type transcriptional activator IlvY [unclassified Pseudomonas]AYF90106.1 HTH-type transcriptional activator IlvY [Pseudomonas sp. DY-1]MDH4651978.1 HTH-type transcriptional activator IlvY [Pseudomonas sp. BN606]MRK22448.1 HTH-type transcriptional activator IlvY [Pseudomonas sp. JG-B]WVK92316.1 HTH-type transcriptional activator IlvY [Pseudomonas sp. JS3066]